MLEKSLQSRKPTTSVLCNTILGVQIPAATDTSRFKQVVTAPLPKARLNARCAWVLGDDHKNGCPVSQ